ncbi:hypothetical protein [Streptomyces rubellomurinus]|uniref:Integral membrane protein n=2 Tax=Streptomyces TaxID=1883 RepID=A0A0F2TH89_STRR3|nr:hypothetical protein [Streptomyces rubellomurinus]KJS55746.1 hypothetical protein VM98_11290 [Streptomyces rubellomurinus subsp. indigoferus]KJS62529.1 hypothetical protein VM95_07940 [Streptomyces rubellomurinus]
MDTRQDELRRDLDATLQARKELGKEYEDELVDSFMKRLDSRLDARVENAVADRMDDIGPSYRRHHDRPRRGGWGQGRSGNRLAVVSLALGIPLSAIAGSPESGGFAGLLVCWAGIVGVNFAAALGNRLNREERRPRSDWD